MWNTEVSVWAFGILPVGVVMRKVAFSDLSVAVPWRERLARRATVLIQCPVFEFSDGGVQSYESS